MTTTKRDHLLRTAERLFYEEGFHATGIDRIVSGAGVTRMTLYNHFDSKTALIRAVLAARYERYLRELQSAIDARGDDSALGALVAVHGEWLRSRARHGCMVIKAIAEFEKHDGAIAAEARGLKRELLAIIASALEKDGLEPEQTPEAVLMILEGSNALVPVLGADNAIASMHTLLAPWLARAAGASA